MFKFHFKRGLIFAVLGLITGAVIAFLTPAIYEATAEVLLGETTVSNATATLSPDVQRILDVGQASDARTELQVIRSQSIFFQALRNVAQAQDNPELLNEWVRLYLMYDVLTPETRASQQTEGSVATIRVRANSGEIAERVAQQITEVYNDFRVTNARNGLQNAIRYLASQEQALRRSLDEADTKYKQYASDKGIVNIDFSTQSATQLEANSLTRLQEARALFAAAQAEAATLESQLGNFPREVPTGTIDSRSQTVVQLESQIAQGRQQLEILRSRYYEDHPRVQEVAKSVRAMMTELKKAESTGLQRTQSSQQLNPVRQQLEQQVAAVRSRVDGLSRQVSEAETSYETIRQRLRDLPTDEAQMRQLRRDLDVADLNYRRVKQQLDELRSRQETFARPIPVLNTAQAFRDPVAPDRGKFMFIGLIAGLCLGLIYSFAVEAMKLRVHTSQQLSELTGLPVVATIPAMGRGKQRGLKSFTTPGARPGESFRHMAYTFLAKNHDFPRMLMFTGVGMVAGRTSSALQFSVALANAGTKVILVDCDPVRGLVTKAFEADAKTGMSELFDRSTLPSEGSDVLIATGVQNLSLLPVGADPSKSLADRPTAQIEAIVGFLKDKADVIVFDTPPCDMFSDSSRLASLVDEVCMVVSANTTNYSQIPNGYEILQRAGAKDVSLVLTDASANDEPFANTKGYNKGV